MRMGVRSGLGLRTDMLRGSSVELELKKHLGSDILLRQLRYLQPNSTLLAYLDQPFNRTVYLDQPFNRTV
jgi:hypothetical protein